MTRILTLLTLCVYTFSADALDRPDKPNIVLLLTDDLGWQDVKCYDIDEPSPAETPNIDALAKKGVMFWQAYSPAPTCAPSRCAIISGNHPARAQKTHVVGGAPPMPINKHFRMMDPWYSGRMPEDELTLPKLLRENGYTTGHSGKWHMAIDHHAFPQPADQGFDYTQSSRGARAGMADRLKGFATKAPDDPYRLDKNGFPFHQTNEDALTFLKENKDKPFFLYYATWLVHSPIQTRSEDLLKKYAEKLGINPENTPKKETPGQKNPFFASMVEELDYYVGQVFDYLEETEDPRWPGHKLSENTYLFFTSDNGGMEGSPKERYTDNNPLDRGKISAKEGGTRVPLIITGPGINAGIQTDVMANGLDFFPTILAMTGTSKPDEKHLDGCDLTSLLRENPTDPKLVKHPDGTVRDTMVWHFPHGHALESTIRVGDFKLIRNYDHVGNPGEIPLELFRLYETRGGKQVRSDIEEAKNLSSEMPDMVKELNERLTAVLSRMKASYPTYNPDYPKDLPNKEKVCTISAHQRQGQNVEFTFSENGAKVVHADLIFTRNGGDRYEEWFRGEAEISSATTAKASLPEGTTHYFINLIDENNFLRSYPAITTSKTPFFESAIPTEGEAPKMKEPKPKPKLDRNKAFQRMDVDKDNSMTLQEYKAGMNNSDGTDLDARYKRFDENGDGTLSRDEFVHPGKR